jgi:NitT/TauT family transport system substrate-binding protein
MLWRIDAAMHQPCLPSRARALGSFAFAAAAFAALGTRGSPQSRPAVRVAALPSEAAAEVFYAQEMGFFANAGIDVDVQTMQNGAAVASAVASNAVDIGWTTPVSLAIARQKGIPFLTIAPAVLYTAAAPFTALFVAAGSPIRTAADLHGKVIGANGLGTMTEYGPRAWIDRNGGDSTQVRFLELPFSAMVDSLVAGRVDAAEIGEPALAVATAKNHLLAYPMNAVANEFLFGVWFGATAWVKAHPDVVARFVAAIHTTAAWANQPANQTRSGAILSQYTKIPSAAIATMTRARYGEVLSPSLIQPVVDVAAHYLHFASFPAQELLYAPAR